MCDGPGRPRPSPALPLAPSRFRKVSLWLGHANIQSTKIYLRSDSVGKLEILGETLPPSITRGMFKDATDRVIAVLQETRIPRE